ncbi:hypothetical protein BJ994_001586 [Arthrobacter pigmenti]|uniref:DUF6993 domain-containing protein n=1 Tax=Arthrobacter pigmenti TaxID=271432 RepID=A0A846RLI8_9MICC|nr:hypothetical protein [Arthrobacter pigmenti]NJC22510.1 hypothetical protein [Arthrobacter pigmenti]
MNWRTAGPARGQVVVLCVGMAVVLGGCVAPAVGDELNPGKDAQAGQSSGEVVPQPGQEESSGPAAAFASEVKESLTALAVEVPKPGREAVRGAFITAGAEEGSVQVSLDTTPTGLEVDAITGAVAVESVCVFGHVRDGEVSVTRLPVLAGGNCFVGDQR